MLYIQTGHNDMLPYEHFYENTINTWHPYYLDSYFIKTTKKTETAYDNAHAGGIDSIQNITDYEYFDADHTGATDSEGYDILLHEDGDTDNWQQLQWEPSWEVIQFNATGISAPDTGPPPPPDARELMPAPYGNTSIIDLPDYNLQGSLMTQNADLDANDTLDLQYHYTYDEFNRLDAVFVSYTDDKEQGYKVASYTYNDALGLVEEVKYYASGNDTDLKNTEIEVITHTYDVRDRLTQLDAALFRWQMFYDDQNAANAQSPTTSWNGNINSTVADYKFADVVNVGDLADFASPTTYTYDNLNRLTVADAHGVKAGQATLGDVTYSYDKIGNLQTLNRKTWDAATNNLQTQNYSNVYQANTNRLLRVEAGANRYTYDENGNMVSDADKNLDNTLYGRANLPYQLNLSTGNQINYQYNASDMRHYKKVDSLGTILKEEYYLRDATGRELAVIDNEYNVNWYIYGKERVASMRHQLPVGMSNLFITGNIPDGLHYAPNELSTDGTVQSADAVILQAGDCVAIMPGFSTPADADFTAEIKTQPVPQFTYYLYDHLGNTRITYSVEVKAFDDIDYTVQSATDYYPYGKALRTYGKERYQSTYHERDVESGFDYRGARFYDGDVGRFNSLDPLAADYPEFSDYLYVAGNPIIFIDPNGKNTIYYSENGEELYRSEDGLENAVVIVSADNLDSFNELLKNCEICSSDASQTDIDAQSSILRGLGTNYMVDGMIDFLEGTKGVTTTEHDYYKPELPLGRPIKLSTEASSFLYLNESGAVVIGTESFGGNDVEVTGWEDPENPFGGEPIGKLHTHPNSGVTLADRKGYTTTLETSPSLYDLQNHTSIDGYRNVVVDNTNIHLYSKQHTYTISAPRAFFENFKK